MKKTPINGAFVLKLGLESEVTQGKVEGTVEHIESGRTLRFQSLNELLGFLTEELHTARERKEN